MARAYARAVFRVRVLGGLTVETADGIFEPPATRKTLALLGWLVLHPGMLPRASVAAALWPDVLDASAQRSLRTALWSLRTALGTAADVLLTTRDRVGLDPESVSIDVQEFDALVAAGRLEEAVGICAGELLAGFEDEWAIRARDTHRQRLADVLDALAARAAAGGDPAAAVRWARRRSALDPLSEEGARALMTRLAVAGDRAAALSVYDRLVERLRDQLSIAVSAQTRRLASELRGATAPRPRSGRGRVPLVGRRDELAALREAWEQARSGAGGAVLLRGPAGIGKTRLVGELCDETAEAGGMVATGGAPDLGDPPPFALWAEVASELVRRVRPPEPAAGWAGDLARLAPRAEAWLTGRARRAPATPELERMRLFEAVLSLVEHAAAQAPVLLALEDIDNADPSSLELTGYIVRRLPEHRALAVVTSREPPRRPEAAAIEHGLRARDAIAADLVLAPLDADDTRTLATSVARLSTEQLTTIVAAAQGNPLLAVEAARALARGEASASGGLRGAVRAALVGLTPTARQLVEAAAVAGCDLTADEAGLLIPDGAAEKLAAAVAAAESTGLVECSEGRIRFGHSLLREAAYDDIPELRRAALHGRVAGVLAAGGDAAAAETAAHLRLARREDEAAQLLLRAAAHARRIAALSEAEAFLAEAARLRPADAQVALEQAEVQLSRGHHGSSSESFERALALLEQAGDVAALAGAHFRRGRWHYSLVCIPRLAADELQRGLDVLEGSKGAGAEERAAALAGLAWVEAIGGDPERAEQLVDELEAQGAGADALVAVELGRARASALIRRGKIAESHAHGVKAALCAQHAGRPDLAYGCWVNSAGAAAAVGDFSRALNYLDRCLAGVRGRGLWAIESQVLCGRAWVLARQQRLGEAEAAALEAASLADRVGAEELRATADHERARIALAAGRWEQAERLLAAALDCGGRFSRPLARLERAEALARLGRRDAAEDELRAVAVEPLTAGDWPGTLVARMARVEGLIAVAGGDRDLAIFRLDSAARVWRRHIGSDDVGTNWAAALVDLGRPVIGVVEPQLELERVLDDQRRLDSIPATTEV
jgi:DNA-binding SARP family transcriptional activator/tetratricopeptide (TPR) repeat protein